MRVDYGCFPAARGVVLASGDRAHFDRLSLATVVPECTPPATWPTLPTRATAPAYAIYQLIFSVH